MKKELHDFMPEEEPIDEDILMGIQYYGETKMKDSIRKIMEEASAPKQTARIFKLPSVRWAIAASITGILITFAYLLPQQWNKSDHELAKEEINTTFPDSAANPSIPPREIASTPVDTDKQLSKKQNTGQSKESDRKASDNEYLAVAESNYDFSQSMLSTGTVRTVDTAYAVVMMDSLLTLIRQKDFSRADALSQIMNSRQEIKQKYASRFQISRAHIFFSTQQYEKSIALFKEIATTQQSFYKEEAQYFLLLGYLTDYKKYENEFALLSTKILGDSDHAFHEQCVALVTKLKKK